MDAAGAARTLLHRVGGDGHVQKRRSPDSIMDLAPELHGRASQRRRWRHGGSTSCVSTSSSTSSKESDGDSEGDADEPASPAQSAAGTRRRSAPAEPRSQVPLCVAVRVRPPNEQERGRDEKVVWEADPKSGFLRCCCAEDEGLPRGPGRAPSDCGPFAHVFPPAAGTAAVFAEVGAPIVEGVLEGFHGTIFAYGETGSGKSHTLLGSAERPGVAALALQQLFAQAGGMLQSSAAAQRGDADEASLAAREARSAAGGRGGASGGPESGERGGGAGGGGASVRVKVGLHEIYGDAAFDLLRDPPADDREVGTPRRRGRTPRRARGAAGSVGTTPRTPARAPRVRGFLRESPRRGSPRRAPPPREARGFAGRKGLAQLDQYEVGSELTLLPVESAARALELIASGERRRASGLTSASEHASRSHLVLQLRLETALQGVAGSEVTASNLYIVDLAGSETADDDDDDRQGTRRAGATGAQGPSGPTVSTAATRDPLRQRVVGADLHGLAGPDGGGWPQGVGGWMRGVRVCASASACVRVGRGG